MLPCISFINYHKLFNQCYTDGSLGYFQFFRITFYMHNNPRHFIYKLRHLFSFSDLRNLRSAIIDNKQNHPYGVRTWAARKEIVWLGRDQSFLKEHICTFYILIAIHLKVCRCRVVPERSLSFESAFSTPKFRCSSQPLGSANQSGNKIRPGSLAASWQSCPQSHFWKGKGVPRSPVPLGQKCHPDPQPTSITIARDSSQSSLHWLGITRSQYQAG